jgi:hypothetical protein
MICLRFALPFEDGLPFLLDRFKMLIGLSLMG